MLFPYFFPVAQITFLTPPERPAALVDTQLPEMLVPAVMIMAVLAVMLLALRQFRAPSQRRRIDTRPRILVDGSNVMHWKDETPQISTVLAVVRALEARGFATGVVFDANAGYKLRGRYLNENLLAGLLDLPESQVFVVPKGTQADPYLLGAARDIGARVVTRDWFRDWAEAHPEVREPGFLIRGGYRSTGELWLDETADAPVRKKA